MFNAIPHRNVGLPRLHGYATAGDTVIWEWSMYYTVQIYEAVDIYINNKNCINQSGLCILPNKTKHKNECRCCYLRASFTLYGNKVNAFKLRVEMITSLFVGCSSYFQEARTI